MIHYIGSILSWDVQSGNNIPTTDGSHFTFHSEQPFELSTGQNIPDSLNEFIFEVEVETFSDNTAFAIGMESDTSYVEYHSGLGAIHYGKGVLLDVGGIEENSIISYELRRICFDDKTTQIISFLKNNLVIGSLPAQGENFRPKISFIPREEELGSLKIKAVLGSCEPISSIGNFGKLSKSFLLNSNNILLYIQSNYF